MLKIAIFGLFSAIGYIPLYAQPALFQNPHIITQDKGLPSNRLTRIAHDAEGLAWIGSLHGLARFDGTSVEVFLHNNEDSSSIASNTIRDVLPDIARGNIWVGTSVGISRLDIKTKKFKNYQHDPGNPFSAPDHQASRFFKDRDGQIWMGFREKGLVRYRPETDDFEHFICTYDRTSTLPDVCNFDVWDIIEDPDDHRFFWLATSKGILHFDKTSGSFEQYYFEVEDAHARAYLNAPLCLYLHTDGKIYFGTWWEGVGIFDPNTRTYSRLNPCYRNGTLSFGIDMISGFYPKSNYEFWINSAKGLQLYDLRTACITKSYINDEDNWYSIDHIDEAGRIWSISSYYGLRIFSPLLQQFKVLPYVSPDEKRSFLTRKILEDTLRKKLYVAAQSTQGLYVQDQITGQWQCIQPLASIGTKKGSEFAFWDIAFLEDGALLIVDNFRLYWYKPGWNHLQLYPVQPLHENARLRNVVIDHDGYYWISSYNAGIQRLDVNKGEILSFEDSLKKIWPRKLGGDRMVVDVRGNVWIREHNGLLIYERKKGRFIYHHYNPEDLKAYRGMGVMEADASGRVWIATRTKYLGYAHADSLDRGVIRFLGKNEGLEDEKVWLVKLYKSKLLVFTEEHLQILNPDKMQFERSYDLNYGLKFYNSNATLLSSGEIAVGQNKAFAVFSPETLKINQEKPRAYITSFKVFDNPWLLNNSINRPDSIFLSHKENFFSFEFSSIGFNMAEKISYRYKLEGFDKDWQDGTQRRFAAYTNVPGGDYRFIVEAFNNEGIAFEKPSITYLHISTVWWKTAWFWGIMALVLFILGRMISKWRIAQVRKEERVKSEYERKLAGVELSALRAQMNPHFIFNSLNSIEYYIINNEPEKASDYLNRFSRLIRLILQNSKSTRVPLKDELEALKLYIEMESMRFDNLFNYEVKVESSIDSGQISVPPLLIQPYVENAIWHGLMQKAREEKGKLDLSIRRENGHLLCMIEDNGIGREAARLLKSKSATRRKSYGMKITSDRMYMLNKLAGADASVEVKDLYHADGSAAGTRVELMIPLAQK